MAINGKFRNTLSNTNIKADCWITLEVTSPDTLSLKPVVLNLFRQRSPIIIIFKLGTPHPDKHLHLRVEAFNSPFVSLLVGP